MERVLIEPDSAASGRAAGQELIVLTPTTCKYVVVYMLLSAFTSDCYGQCWDPRTILRGEAFGKTSIRLHCSPVDVWTTPSWISLANEHILVGIIGLMDHLQKIILMNGLEVWIDHRTETMFPGGGW